MRLRVTAKRVRREGINLDGRDKMARVLQKRPYPPGVHGPTGNGRQTDYGKQLREKQRAKLVFGVMERQFRNYFEKAVGMKGDSGQALVQMLEMRLDNALFRAGFAKTRAAARQAISHKHVEVNGKIVNVASYQVRPGEVIKIRNTKREKGLWKAMAENMPKVEVPSWISADPKEMEAKITSKPAGEELKQLFDTKLIIEFYSR
ncbi:MAG: 30S ribosomal protein S4 [Patescibacteria group bacterium]|jgi:small subunit ribosomal protein S4